MLTLWLYNMIIISSYQFNALEKGLEEHSLLLIINHIEKQRQQNHLNLETLSTHDLAKRVWSLCQRSGGVGMDSILFLVEKVLSLGLQHKIAETTDTLLPGTGHSEKVRIERYIAELSTHLALPFIRLPAENAIMDYFHG